MIIEKDYDLFLNNGYRIHAVAQTAIFPETPPELEEIFFDGKMAGALLLGRGYNIILSQSYYEQPVVILNDNFSEMLLQEEDCIMALSGTDMRELANFAADEGLSGLEIYCDIPSSVGGAIFMNASASGRGMENSLVEVKALMPDEGIVKSFRFDEMDTRYRYSIFQDNGGIILSAKFQMVSDEKEAIRQRMTEIKELRHNKQPQEYPNAGSVFKRPDGRFVGQMVEKLGLKGFRIGGAMVSTKHAGFIVNFDNATGSDILMLIEEIQRRVTDAFGITLELEQRVI